MKNQRNTKLSSVQSQASLNQMKAEIANEFGVSLGADATARQNGAVGGEITKRLVAQSQSQLGKK